MYNVSLQTYHHHITATLFLCITLSVLGYMYFLSLSVVHVVMRKEVLHDIASLRSEIAVLEAEYIAAHHTVSARVASLDGYNTVTEKVFLSALATPPLVVQATE